MTEAPQESTGWEGDGPRPNFFLVGASRAGTTSLWTYLDQHPDVFFPSTPFPKEPSHFCDLTPVWAQAYADTDAYLEGYRAANGQIALGDASTTYLPSPEVPARIRERVPDARIIIVLRNPADRAFSLYSLLCQLGFEWIAPFERALEEEERRLGNEEFKHGNPFWYYAYLYFHSGLYGEQVRRYLDAFPPEQVKIVLFDSLRRQPLETARGVFEFLGVDPTFEPAITLENRSMLPLLLGTQNRIARVWKAHPLKGMTEQSSLTDRLCQVGFAANLILGQLRRRRRLDPQTRRELLQRYRDDIRLTGALIGVDLAPWLEGHEVLVP